jgi:apolipoprotein D and lipocalin family protein
MNFMRDTGKILLLAICLPLIALACSKATPSHTALTHAPSIDLNRMTGEWHVVARISTLIDREAHEMVVTFDVRPDAKMAIDWRFKDKNSGKQKSWALSAQAGQGSETTFWKVSLFWPITFDFRVVEYSGDYSWIVIASPDRRYLWILARDKSINPNLLDGLMNRLELAEFDMKAIIREKLPSTH